MMHSTPSESYGGWFTRRLSHAYIRRWGAYTGLALEQDWMNPRRHLYDLTFLSLLIRHYSRI